MQHNAAIRGELFPASFFGARRFHIDLIAPGHFQHGGA
jgi:hypothetical protein